MSLLPQPEEVGWIPFQSFNLLPYPNLLKIYRPRPPAPLNLLPASDSSTDGQKQHLQRPVWIQLNGSAERALQRELAMRDMASMLSEVDDQVGVRVAQEGDRQVQQGGLQALHGQWVQGKAASLGSLRTPRWMTSFSNDSIQSYFEVTVVDESVATVRFLGRTVS